MRKIAPPSRRNPVIPAKAGIQTKDVNSVFLAPRLRGDDGKIELANGLIAHGKYAIRPSWSNNRFRCCRVSTQSVSCW